MSGMRTWIRVTAALVALATGPAALADGMIVPVRPDLRVRGHWAVKYHHVDMVVRDQVASVTIVCSWRNRFLASSIGLPLLMA